MIDIVSKFMVNEGYIFKYFGVFQKMQKPACYSLHHFKDNIY